MRTRPTATAASRKSVMAERPDKHSLFLGQIGGNWLAGIEAVDEERPVVVRPGWQSSRQQTGQSTERASRSARGQAQMIGDEAWMQLKPRIECAPRNLRSRNNRLPHEAQSERRQEHGPRPRSPRGQEAQTCPCRSGNGRQSNRKITQVRAGNHEPEAKEERGSYRRNPDARRGIALGGAQGANPRSVRDVILDRSWRQQLNGTPERFSFCRSVRLGIAHLKQLPSTSANLPCSPGSANVERLRTCGMAPHYGGMGRRVIRCRDRREHAAVGSRSPRGRARPRPIRDRRP
jgi:hypothetical protein